MAETEEIDKDKINKEKIEEENQVLHLHLQQCLVLGLLRIVKAQEVDLSKNNFKFRGIFPKILFLIVLMSKLD